MSASREQNEFTETKATKVNKSDAKALFHASTNLTTGSGDNGVLSNAIVRSFYDLGRSQMTTTPFLVCLDDEEYRTFTIFVFFRYQI